MVWFFFLSAGLVFVVGLVLVCFTCVVVDSCLFVLTVVLLLPSSSNCCCCCSLVPVGCVPVPMLFVEFCCCLLFASVG